MYIPRFRRINTIVKEIKEFDPDTEFSWNIIKELISDKIISEMKIGNAWLINTDEVFSLFYKEKKNENNNNDKSQ